MSRVMKLTLVTLGLTATIVSMPRDARADVLDCSVTAGLCSSGFSSDTVIDGIHYYEFQGALWSTGAAQVTGTGSIHSFVRLNDNDGTLEGMNTSERPLDLGDENNSPTFTRDIQLSAVPFVHLGSDPNDNLWYLEFLLDINQSDGGSQLESLDAVMVCIGDTGGAYYDDKCGDSPVWEMGGDDYVLLNDGFTKGSGNLVDLHLYIPIGELPLDGEGQVDASLYAYLWSHLGGRNADTGGFDEWAVRVDVGPNEQDGPPTIYYPPPDCQTTGGCPPPPDCQTTGGCPPPPDCQTTGGCPPPPGGEVPEPASMFLLGTGLAGLGAAARKRAKKQASGTGD